MAGYRRKKRKLRAGAVVLLALLLCAAVVLIALAVRHFTRARVSPPASSAPSSQGTLSGVSSAVSSPASASGIAAPSASDPLLILVNKDHAVPDDYNPTLVTLPSKYFVNTGRDMHFDSRAAPSLEKMMDDAAAQGIKLSIWSAYRSKSYQTSNFNAGVQKYLNMGYTSSSAVSAEAQSVAPPGYSEHQTGLSADIVSASWVNSHSELTDAFDETPEYQWLHEHCAEYGFILRYPKDKVSVTNYEYEPWHYRYVGVENAKKIMGSGVCLEEYLKTAK